MSRIRVGEPLTLDLTTRAFRGSRLAFGRSYIRGSISSDRFGVSVTAPPK